MSSKYGICTEFKFPYSANTYSLTVVRKGLFKCLHRIGDGSFLFREAGHTNVVPLLPNVE